MWLRWGQAAQRINPDRTIKTIPHMLADRKAAIAGQIREQTRGS
jgi:hypothetical protein